jgi:lambda family phage portal protein
MAAKVLRHPALVERQFNAAAPAAHLLAWTTAPKPADADILSALRTARARSRNSAQNDDHMVQFLRLVESNVVGPNGVIVQAAPRRASGTADKALAARIEEDWAEQSERGNWTVCGQYHRAACERLTARLGAMDGEVLLRIHEGTGATPTGFGVELIDAEALDMDYNARLANGNTVRMGVELNRFRRPVAYHLFQESDQPLAHSYRAGQAQRIRVPADDIVHFHLPQWAWQTRGIPWGITAIRRMADLEGYETAAITAARAAANKAAQYRREEWANPETGPNGTHDDGMLTQEVSAGEVEVPPYGMYLDPIDWTWPNTTHGEFVRECVRGFASGVGVSYPVLANDPAGVNYTSLRHFEQINRELWSLVQDQFVAAVAQVIYRRWLAYRVRSGKLTRRNGTALDLSRIRDLQRAKFQPRRWRPIDPVKEAQGAQMDVLMGRRSISMLIREDGNDPAEVWDELQSDYAELARRGITPASDWPQPAPEQTNEEQTTDA